MEDKTQEIEETLEEIESLDDISYENNNEELIEKKPEKNNSTKLTNDKLKLIIMGLSILALLISIIVVIISFINDDKKEPTTIVTDKQEVKSEYRLAGNHLQDFDISFLKLENQESNMIYSPLSIKYALEMLKEGANGTSKQQIEAILGDYKPRKYVNNANMSFANAMFINQLYQTKVKDSYTQSLVDKYYAEVIYDSFESSTNINKWVSDKTFGLINNLLPENQQKEKQFYLVNALAIDMEWNKKIQESNPNAKPYGVSYQHEKYSHYINILDLNRKQEMGFNNDKMKVNYLEIGASINKYDILKELGEDNIRSTITNEYNEYLKTNPCGGYPQKDTTTFVESYIKELDSNYNSIKSSTDFEFYTDNDVKVFAKDLKTYENTTLQYVAIMPTNESLKEYVEKTTAADYNKLIKNLKKIELDSFREGVVTKVTGYIPTFKFDYQLNLESDLKKLKVEDIFDKTKADLTGIISDETSYITDALHKANIEFSNDGIKASAATALGAGGAASCGFEHLYEVPVEIINLTFDKPYIFLIRDKDTNEVWFAGTVYEPNLSN